MEQRAGFTDPKPQRNTTIQKFCIVEIYKLKKIQKKYKDRLIGNKEKMQRATRRDFLKKVGIVAVASVAGGVSGVGIYYTLSKQSTTRLLHRLVCRLAPTGFGSKVSYAPITCFDG